MSSDDTTRQLPIEDKLDSLILLVRQLVSDMSDVKSRLATVERDVKAVKTDLADVKARVTSPEHTVEQRLYDTRPIWESVLSRLEEIEINLDKTAGISLDVRSDLRDLRRQFKSICPRSNKNEGKNYASQKAPLDYLPASHRARTCRSAAKTSSIERDHNHTSDKRRVRDFAR